MKALIEIKLKKYKLDISNEEEHLKYLRLTKKAKALGHKLFDTYNHDRTSGHYRKLPLVQNIETELLFDNQYNTKEGFRIFDWCETIYRNKNIKEGYYLTGNLEELKEAKTNQLKCGYCGKRYDKKTTKLIYCDSCLDSRHLEEKELPLLRLQSLTGEKQGSNDVPQELTKAFLKAKSDYQDGQLGRMQLEAAKVLEELKEKQELEQYESQVQHDLLMLGIPIKNLIFYKHLNSWVLGWHNSVTLEEFEAYKMLVNKNKDAIALDANGISLCNLLGSK